jgi:putative endonuclease
MGKRAEKSYYVYIMANKRNGTLYIGITNNLIRRVWEHRKGLYPGFTSTYHLHSLVYFGHTTDVDSALNYEKRLKTWLRKWKLALIEFSNPEWRDLWEEIIR